MDTTFEEDDVPECPNCGKKGEINRKFIGGDDVRFVCTVCGWNKYLLREYNIKRGFATNS